MNYIVLDLEWNQSPSGKEYSVPDMPFEIIQIGAVKLDAELNRIDEFESLIKPQTYMQLHAKVKEILGMKMDDLQEGRLFTEVIGDFLTWCGSEYLFCTWGGTDLVELQRNMKHYQVPLQFPKPFLFYDLQKLFSLCYSDGKSRITLQHAIEQLELTSDQEYHMAVNDARYTANVFQQMDFDKVKKYYSIDTYLIPQSKKDEIFYNFDDYEKYISRGFSSRESAASDREVCSSRCYLCGKPMKRIIKWFATNSKNYYGLFLCEEHGYIKGRFRTKQTDSGRYYVVKILKCTNEAGAEKIRHRKVREQEHRRMKRQNIKEKF